MNANLDPNTAPQKEELHLDIISDELIEDKKKKVRKSEGLFDLINNYLIEISTITLQDKLLFFQLLSAMISAGLPILEGLNLLHGQMRNPKLKWVIADLITSIEQGHSFAEAMRENIDVFDEATCAIMESGEKSGKLNDVMKELVSQFEQLDMISKKVKSVMTYPIVVIVTMIVLGIVVLVFVVPKLLEIFGGVDNLPLPTQIMIFFSNLIRNNWAIISFFCIIAFFVFNMWKKSESGSRKLGSIILALPVIGNILRGMILNRITRIFGFLISAGVPIVDGLKITSHIAGNDIYKEKLLLAADDLKKGISIAENLSDDEEHFPPMLINMISIGEKSASLDTIMLKAADFYKSELERKIDNLSKIMEPIILGFIAVGAVFMILAIYLPILRMNDAILAT